MNDEIDKSVGKSFVIASMQKYDIRQRESLYVRGIFPGKTIHLLQVSPLGDPLIVRVDTQKFAISRQMWACFDFEEQCA